jgi:asparagine N-glycosylation enzyme membrane subunit Stt3
MPGKIKMNEENKPKNDETVSLNNGTKITSNEHARVNSPDVIFQRKEKVVNFLKKKNLWVVGLLVVALILGVYIRSMPMHDHGGNPGLWNVATNDWTLGPDLDPWLFTRYAETIVEDGSIPKNDSMRNVARGFDTSIESKLLPYMIVYTYYFLNIFMDVNVIYAAVIFPVFMFALTILSFFFFVREVFVRKSKKSKRNANIIALISVFFMIVVPAFVSRTIAGIPEKESAGFFFMFLTFYLFLKAWKSKKILRGIIFGFFAGISTAAMGLIWGGVFYIFMPISMATFIAFILNKINKKEFTIYSVWLFSSLILLDIFSNKYSFTGSFTSIQTGLLFIIFFVYLIHLGLWKTRLKDSEILRKMRHRLPENIISLIISMILLVFFVSIVMGPGFIIEKIKGIHNTLFSAVTGRWNVTVAENRQPYFNEWEQSFGPFIKNVPVLFWLFFVGSVVLFKKALNKIKSKDAWILTGFYVLFLLGIIFSRYSSVSMFNGDNLISKFVYYLSAFLFGGFLLYYVIKYERERHEGFKKIDYEYLILFALFLFCLITARSAIRLILVLAPITTIFVGFLIVESIDKFRRVKDETWKIIFGFFVVLILIGSLFTFWTFYNGVKGQAYSFVPSYYNQQWQKAMKWVDEETPEDAVFAHWWDYGYWVQSIGHRATILDGGNAITYWNYLMGRHVLTGDNQDDALEFLYNHDATHLLIDSTDIGKYGAYSSIGSDADYDRLSWIGTFILDEKQTQETQNQTILFYPGGVALDEDLIIEENGKEIFLPSGKSGVGALIVPTESIEGQIAFKQPYVVIVYQGIRHDVNLRYLSIRGEQFIDFGEGIEASAYIFPKLNPQPNGGINAHPFGAVMFISPRLMRGMMAQIYILEDPLKNFENFKLNHTQQNLIVENLEAQGMDLPDFVYYQGIQGPIKIWDIEYTGKEEYKEEYLDTDQSKYLDWKL